MNKQIRRFAITACLALVAAGAALVAGAGQSAPPARTETVEGALRAPPGQPPIGPLAPAPQPWPTSTIVPAPKGTWLPPAEVHVQPRLEAGTGPYPLRLRRASDLPPLADVAGPPPPASRQLQPGPLASAPTPDLNVLPIMPTRYSPQADRMGLMADPTQEQSREAAAATEPPFRSSLAPFVRLAIPDPFESISVVRLAHPPADNEPPAKVTGAAPRPTLPTKP
jgi:hypothetical protein